MSQEPSTGSLATLVRDRTIVLLFGVVLLQALGENLWIKFVPKYLESLAAPTLVIGLYGSLYDFLDGLYQYPGGFISDRFGRKRSLAIFIMLAAAGYAVYWLAASWSHVLLGLVLVMAWHGMASPSIFAVIGDALPRAQHTRAFTLQAVMRRIPLAVGPMLGGLCIGALGVLSGVRLTLALAVLLSVFALLLLSRVTLPRIEHHESSITFVWRTFPKPLRWLLASDIVVRVAEGLVDVFLVLYTTSVRGISAPEFGVLLSVQVVTSLAVYWPAARLADRVGQKPLVSGTFLSFAAFPLAVALAPNFAWMLLAYFVGGLRELGEPSRKALIMNLADARLRGRTIGLYYLVRSTLVAPAALLGATLWRIDPALPFYVAAGVGVLGTLLFVATVSEEYAR